MSTAAATVRNVFARDPTSAPIPRKIATKKAAAVTNHLSCWRSSPLEFLKRSAAETNPIRLNPTTAKNEPTKNGAKGFAEAGQSLISWTRGLDQRKEATKMATATMTPQLASANHATGRQRLDWSCPVGNNS